MPHVEPEPAVPATAKKIMRRGAGPGLPTPATSSQGPSASPSENGGDSDAPRRQPTREEREAKYNEARDRIFGKMSEEAAAAEAAKAANTEQGEAEPKKQRNVSNDDFEPRSRFPGYYGPGYQAPTTSYSSDHYYGQFPQPQPQPAMTPQYNPQTGAYMYPSVAGPVVYGNYNNGGAPVVSGAPAMGNYAAPAPAGYDFNQYFNSMNLQGNTVPAQSTGPPILYPQQQYQNYPNPRPYDPNQLPTSHQPVGGNGYISPMNGQPPVLYPYNAMPSQAYGTAAPAGPHQVHHANAYGMQPFNPQSQSFVPRSAPPMICGPAMSSPGYGGFNQPFRPSPVPHHPAIAVGGLSPNMPRSTHNMFGGYGAPRPANMAQVPSGPRNGTGQGNAANNNRANSPAVNQPSLAEMSAKWGKPASLPAKPPTPVTSEPVMFNQINKTLLSAGLMDPIAAPGAHRANNHGANGSQPTGSQPFPGTGSNDNGQSSAFSNSGRRDEANT
jgi:hypothetical protein